VRALTADCSRLQAGLERSEKRLRTQRLEVATRESLLLGRAVIAHLIRDPLLPAELMSPEPRAALLTATRRYQDKALVLWRKWLALP
jgi:phenylacetic acid degradation operon negative regulatory protein